MSLIIVESPTKAKTFNKIVKINKLNHFVFATYGHIRDLPKNKLAIDYKNNFEPQYQLIKSKSKVINSLKKLAKENKEIILATDLDREGEAIAYHVAYILGFANEKWPEIKIKENNHNLKRIVFHEITPQALINALNKPEVLRLSLVKAQQARRILDRIVGYELSPLLWKKMGKTWLSAGRVQTVALRLIVEREKEIKAFKQESYWLINGIFLIDKKITLNAKLTAIDNQPLEITNKIKLFDGDYQYKKTILDGKRVNQIVNDLKQADFYIKEIIETSVNRFPPPPFTTSIIQQEAFRKLHFSSKMTMKLAQDLYEKGFITYHRTDSFNLSTQFLFKARDYIKKTFGDEYALEKPRQYRTKSKNAQEAHEAIRPTDLNLAKSVDKINNDLTRNHLRLYQLIYNRALATQMKEAQIKMIKLLIDASSRYLFSSEIEEVIFPGFLKLLNPEFVKNHANKIIVNKESKITLDKLIPEEKLTSPPWRYNEASLIRSLEEKGIGRPSTYALIVSLIQEKNYVEKQNQYFIPTKLGIILVDYLSQSFPKIFDLSFTAEMEDKLDEIALGKKDIIKVLLDFYEPFKKMLDQSKKDKKEIETDELVDEQCPLCHQPLVIRYSRYGKFLACSRYPDCKFTKPFLKFIDGKKCPKCGGRIVIRFTKSKKRFYGCENYPKCDFSSWKLKDLK